MIKLRTRISIHPVDTHFDFFRSFLMTLDVDEAGLRLTEDEEEAAGFRSADDDADAGRRQTYFLVAGFFHAPTDLAARR